MEKEREGKDKSRKISPSVDLVTRLDFDVLWSKWYLDPSEVGETHKTQIPEGLNICLALDGMPRHLPWGRDFYAVFCSTLNLLQHCGSCSVLWWKTPGIILGVFLGSLMVYDIF